jgi:hypothetical protein
MSESASKQTHRQQVPRCFIYDNNTVYYLLCNLNKIRENYMWDDECMYQITSTAIIPKSNIRHFKWAGYRSSENND